MQPVRQLQSKKERSPPGGDAWLRTEAIPIEEDGLAGEIPKLCPPKSIPLHSQKKQAPSAEEIRPEQRSTRAFPRTQKKRSQRVCWLDLRHSEAVVAPGEKNPKELPGGAAAEASLVRG